MKEIPNAELDPLTLEALSLARLPPPSEAELRAREGLAEATLQAWQRSQRRRALWRRTGAGLAVAAAAAAMMLAPGALRKVPDVERLGQQVQAAAWQAPDPDDLWETAALADLAADDAASTPESAALAALNDTEPD